MVRRCKAKTVAGSPCSAMPVRADGYCYWHSPALKTERDEARRRGGTARSNESRARKRLPKAVMTAGEIQGLVGQVLRGVVAGDVEPAIGNCVANLARSLVTVREATELEERIAELEARAGIVDTRRSA